MVRLLRCVVADACSVGFLQSSLLGWLHWALCKPEIAYEMVWEPQGRLGRGPRKQDPVSWSLEEHWAMDRLVGGGFPELFH